MKHDMTCNETNESQDYLWMDILCFTFMVDWLFNIKSLSASFTVLHHRRISILLYSTCKWKGGYLMIKGLLQACAKMRCWECSLLFVFQAQCQPAHRLSPPPLRPCPERCRWWGMKLTGSVKHRLPSSLVAAVKGQVSMFTAACSVFNSTAILQPSRPCAAVPCASPRWLSLLSLFCRTVLRL